MAYLRTVVGWGVSGRWGKQSNSRHVTNHSHYSLVISMLDNRGQGRRGSNPSKGSISRFLHHLPLIYSQLTIDVKNVDHKNKTTLKNVFFMKK